MDGLDPLLEDCEAHKIYIEFVFEEWPRLATLNETSLQHLCAAISSALDAAACPVQAIKAKPDGLYVVVKIDGNLSIDGIADIVDVTARNLALDGETADGPLSYSAESLGPADVVEAALRLR